MTPGLRLFALLAWTPALGAALTPVGALAVAPGDDGAPLRWQVSFIPRLGGLAEPWQIRLAGGVTGQAVAGWLADAATVALVELDIPPNTVDAAGAAEAAVDEMLATVLPALIEAGAL